MIKVSITVPAGGPAVVGGGVLGVMVAAGGSVAGRDVLSGSPAESEPNNDASSPVSTPHADSSNEAATKNTIGRFIGQMLGVRANWEAWQRSVQAKRSAEDHGAPPCDARTW